MPDFSVVATVISTTGTLLGALGGVALTYGVTVRREEAQARRQRMDQRTQARRQAYVDLLGTATQLKVEIEIAGQPPGSVCLDNATSASPESSSTQMVSGMNVARGISANSAVREDFTSTTVTCRPDRLFVRPVFTAAGLVHILGFQMVVALLVPIPVTVVLVLAVSHPQLSIVT